MIDRAIDVRLVTGTEYERAKSRLSVEKLVTEKSLIEDVPGFNMPAIGIQADDSMEPLAKVGDTSADLVKRFTSDYAALDRCRITPRKDAVKFIWKRVYE
jgi:hypothetical protein